MTEAHEHPIGPETRVEERTEALRETEHAAEMAVDRGHESRHVMEHWLRQVLYLVFGVMEGLLAIRFFLALLGANPAAPFVAFIRGLTQPLVAPFLGIFPTFQQDGFVWEPHTIVAMLVYGLLLWLLVHVVSLLFTHEHGWMMRGYRH